MMKKDFPHVQTQGLRLSAVTGQTQFHTAILTVRTDTVPSSQSGQTWFHPHQPGEFLRTSSESDFNTENFRANQFIEAELEDFIVLFLKIYY